MLVQINPNFASANTKLSPNIKNQNRQINSDKNKYFYGTDTNVNKPSAMLLNAYYIKQTNFKGTPYKLPNRNINNALDATRQWELLRFAKYSDATTDVIYPESKKIRIENYSFLDKLTSKEDKEFFIKTFKEHTGFPNLSETSGKIKKEFKRATHKIAASINNIYSDSTPANIILSGHDYTSSVGQGLALPGSDLNKAYVVLKGFNDPIKDAALCKEFKNQLWDEVDQRLLGVNKKGSMPMVYTEAQVHNNLTEFSNVIDIGDNFNYFTGLRLNALDPINGAHYNILLANKLSPQKAEQARDFAYLIETVRDGAKNEYDDTAFGQICNKMNQSQFSWCSNVAQLKALDDKIQYEGIKREKLDQREILQSEFDSYDVDKQYDIVKNIIKGSSKDHDEKYSTILDAPSRQRERPSSDNEELIHLVMLGENNIDARRTKLDAILVGKIGYENYGEGFERFYI